MPSIIQRSFAGGEVAPAVYGRADQVKYQTGLATCRNFFVRRHGGVSNRPGSQFISHQKDSSVAGRIMKFVFNASQTYILWFENETMRVVKNGVLLTVSGVTAWSGATAYLVGDLVVSGGINYYCILDHTNHVPPNATYWYALTGNIYEIPTPYSSADLGSLQFVQSGDIVTIVHPNYAPRDLSRSGDTEWILEVIDFTPDQVSPTSLLVTKGAAGAKTFRYKVTAVQRDTFEESLSGLEATKNITGATQANPCKLTVVAHGYQTGDEVFINNVGGMVQLNGLTVVITRIDADNFTLNGINSTAYGAYTSGGTVQRTAATTDAAADPTSGAPHVVTWVAAADALEYNIYKENNGSGAYGLIGVAAGTTFNDTGITPDMDFSPPIDRNPYSAAGDFPSTTGYYQQRKLYGNTINEPEAIKASVIGSFKNFTISSPLQDDDAVDFIIAGRQVNSVRHLIDLGKLVVLTESGEWTILGDANGAMTPEEINPRQDGYFGASAVAPVIIGNSIIYLQSRGTIVRDLRFEQQSDGYSGRDLTVFAPHLFDRFTLIRMDYAQIPNSIMYGVRSDGWLLCMTYLRDHEIWGWARWDTNGYYEDVCVIPEGLEDSVYVLVQRQINGVVKRGLERFSSRLVEDVTVDARFLDSYLSYDGWNTGSTTMTLSGGTNWTIDEALTLTASAGFFVAGDVGNAIVLTLDLTTWTAESGFVSTTETLTCNIIGYTSPTVVTVRANKTVPTTFRNVAFTTWAKAVDEISGLDHLEGKVVAVVGDGNVLSNGIDAPLITVLGGAIPTLERPYSVIHVGLPYTSDFELLDLEVLGGETLIDKPKLIDSAVILVEASRGMWFGPNFSKLKEWKQRTAADGYGVIPPLTGKVEVNFEAGWDTSGKVVIRQRDPMPLTILTVVPNGEVGG